jgi:hypothetical protein
MKKLFLTLTAALMATSIYSQSDSTNKMNHEVDNRKMENQDRTQTGVKSTPNLVMMHDGKMVMVHDGKLTNIDHDMTMSNGTKVMSDGTVIKKDGSKTVFKDGERMDMTGNMMRAEKSKDMYLVPDSTKNNNH